MSGFWSFPQKIRRNRSVSVWSMSGRAKSPKPITTEDIVANQLLGALMGKFNLHLCYKQVTRFRV